MTRVLVIVPHTISGNRIADLVRTRLQETVSVERCEVLSIRDDRNLVNGQDADTLVYFPSVQTRQPEIPELSAVKALFEQGLHATIRQVVVVSSAAIYGAQPQNPGLIHESQPLSYGSANRLARAWIAFEELVEELLAHRADTTLTILRPAHVLMSNGQDYFSRFFSGRMAFTLAGHDPSIQWLHPDDLARAVASVVEHRPEGVYNVAPDGVLSLRAGLRLARVTRIPLPRWVQRLGRWLAPKSAVNPIDQVEYIRYSWTVSNAKMKAELGFSPAWSSVETFIQYVEGNTTPSAARERLRIHCKTHTPSEIDDFGLDKQYLHAYGRTLFKFLHDYYWRVECKGIEHIPKEGRALLAGVHRGFMPLDGVITMHLIVKETGRYPRFLIHPTLIKFPFQFNFMTKIGGIIACQQNADYVLSRDNLVGFYPEGIQGAFRYYRGVYTLGKFGRDEFVRMALRNQAPIVPFVTVGNAEIFPVVAKIKWGGWIRFTLWPCFPIAPPFPLLPIPLPSKWHVQFLEPFHIERQYPPEAADDPTIVRTISQAVKERMQAAIDDMLARRKSIWFGSIFEEGRENPAPTDSSL